MTTCLSPVTSQQRGRCHPRPVRLYSNVSTWPDLPDPNYFGPSTAWPERLVTKWNVACDKRLHRLISYIHYHKDDVLISFVGDEAKDCTIAMFCDASFAGDKNDSKSTSGC